MRVRFPPRVDDGLVVCTGGAIATMAVQSGELLLQVRGLAVCLAHLQVGRRKTNRNASSWAGQPRLLGQSANGSAHSAKEMRKNVKSLF